MPPKRSHSVAAQGGMQASLADVIKGQGDNEIHFEDTGARQQLGRRSTGRQDVRQQRAQGGARVGRLGVPWSRVRKGDRDVIMTGRR